jgi:hypothetical protein
MCSLFELLVSRIAKLCEWLPQGQGGLAGGKGIKRRKELCEEIQTQIFHGFVYFYLVDLSDNVVSKL